MENIERLRRQLGEAGFKALVSWAADDPKMAEAELRKVVWGVPIRRINRNGSAPLRDARQPELPLE